MKNKMKKALLCMLVTGCMLATNMTSMWAGDSATITHTHNDSCYSDTLCGGTLQPIYWGTYATWVAGSDHTSCQNCGKSGVTIYACQINAAYGGNTYQTYTTYLCTPSTELNRSMEGSLWGYVCKTCGKVYPVGTTGTCTAVTGKVLSCGIEEGAVVASISMAASTTSWTNQDVTLTVSSSGLSPTGYIWNNGSTSSSITVSSNGSYSCGITVSDQGATKSASVDRSVTNIDKVSPSLSLSLSGSTITAVATDAESGIASYQWNDGTSGSSLTASKTGTYTCVVTDNAGNQTSKSTEVIIPEAKPVIVETPKDTLVSTQETTNENPEVVAQKEEVEPVEVVTDTDEEEPIETPEVVSEEEEVDPEDVVASDADDTEPDELFDTSILDEAEINVVEEPEVVEVPVEINDSMVPAAAAFATATTVSAPSSGFFLFMFFFWRKKVRITALSEEGLYETAGKARVRRHRKGYSVRIPAGIIHNAVSNKIRIELSEKFVKKHHEQPIVIVLDDREITAPIEQFIDFTV